MTTRVTLLAFAVLSAVGAAADAQWAPPPPNRFGSNSNYVMGNTGCPVLNTNVTVTVKITKDLIAQSTTCGGVPSTNGFGFQLNANAPDVSSLTNTQSKWQQYNINVSPTEITAHTQLWAALKGAGKNIPDQNIVAVPTATIPANWTLTWSLDMDSSGNVINATYTVTDASGTSSTVSQPVGALYAAPISSFQLDLVGMFNGCAVTFKQGAGQITYTATSSFNALTHIPFCGNTFTTAESSPNSIYGPVPSGSNYTVKQNFYITPYALAMTWINPDESSTASGTYLGDSLSPTTLSSAGYNAVTLAPGNFQDFSWLSNGESLAGNAQENQCTYSSTAGYVCNLTTGIYNWGLALGTDGNLFGWTRKGGVWLNNVNTGWGNTAAYTSVAPVTATNVFLTNAQDTSCASTSTTSGPCIYYSGGLAPAKWNNFGATQVSVDSMQTTTDLFAIDAATNAVYDISTGSSPTATALPTALCGGAGTLVADQIAIKDGIVFAIQDNGGNGGWIYAYSPSKPNCPDGSGTKGWSRVGIQGGILSIATDQVAGMDGSAACAVWGSDANDQLWCGSKT
jgi:hypothetical protein